MNKFISMLLSLLGLAAPSDAPERSAPSGVELFHDLRMNALTRGPAEFGISRDRYPEDVWGILVEIGLEEGSLSLVVLADGSTSLYFSSGGGVIGAGEHDSVRRAGAALLARANRAKAEAKPTQEYPLPTSGQVLFYFRSYDGVLTYTARERDLEEKRDRLSVLFYSTHEVIAAIREMEQQKRPSPGR